MLYIRNDSFNPTYNQAFEETVFETYTKGDILLLWRNRPAVVVGRYQNIFEEVHIPTAKAHNVELIRRVTGGGCVYHDEGNINYTLITDADESVGYEKPLGHIISVLNSLGVPAQRGSDSGIYIDGKKISGSAQRVFHNRLLHHGTLLFDADIDRLRLLANGHSARYISKAIRSVPAPVVNIRDYVDMSTDTFQARLLGAFCPNSEVIPDKAFTELVQTRANEKYRDWQWTYGNSPAFDFESGSTCYSAKKGLMHDVVIDKKPYPELENARLDYAELCSVLSETNANKLF